MTGITVGRNILSDFKIPPYVDPFVKSDSNHYISMHINPSHQLTECLHLPQHNSKSPHVSLKAVEVVLEVLWWVPAQWHPLLICKTQKVSLAQGNED